MARKVTKISVDAYVTCEEGFDPEITLSAMLQHTQDTYGSVCFDTGRWTNLGPYKRQDLPPNVRKALAGR